MIHYSRYRSKLAFREDIALDCKIARIGRARNSRIIIDRLFLRDCLTVGVHVYSSPCISRKCAAYPCRLSSARRARPSSTFCRVARRPSHREYTRSHYAAKKALSRESRPSACIGRAYYSRRRGDTGLFAAATAVCSMCLSIRVANGRIVSRHLGVRARARLCALRVRDGGRYYGQ